MYLLTDRAESALALIKQDSLSGGTTPSVLILVSNEVDSICAARMFTSLLKDEFIAYIHLPVSCIEDIHEARKHITKQIRSLVMINCGGTIDVKKEILDECEFGSTVITYIFDSHRPLHEENINDNERVIILADEETGSDLFQQEGEASEESPLEPSDDEDDDELEEERASRGKRSRTEKSSKKEKKKRGSPGSYYGTSAARMVYDFAFCLNKRASDMLWLAIIGLTDQMIHNRITPEKYQAEVDFFAGEQDSLNTEEMTDSSIQNVAHNADGGNGILLGQEFRFFMYRHWSLFESMCHSPYIASQLSVWKDTGKDRIKMMLVMMGVPLEDCQNSWTTMSAENKRIIKQKLSETASKYSFDDITFPAFYKNLGFKLQVSAPDIVYAISAILETPFALTADVVDSTKPWESNYWMACDALSCRKIELLKKGIERAISHQQLLVRQAASILVKKTIHVSGPFCYTILPNVSVDLQIFLHPAAISRLGTFLSMSKKLKSKPYALLIGCAETKSYMIAGFMDQVPDIYEKNEFGWTFPVAIAKTYSNVTKHKFDLAMVEVSKDHAEKLIEYMHSGVLLNK